MKSELRCKRCTYNSLIPGISFDDKTGICNYCYTHDELSKQYPTGKKGKENLLKIVEKIKKSCVGKKYDCIVGVSGGCDSSYLLVKTKELGLRPLAVHFDNTYNSKTATDNIYKVITKLNIDLETYVVNNKEFDDILLAFLKASAADFEAPTDIGFTAVLYKIAVKYGIKYIFDGHSFRTEGIAPLDWSYMDGKYVYSVHKKYGKVPMKTFPNLSIGYFLYAMALKNIKRIRPLYFLDYNKEKAKKFLSDNYGWKWYGGHHLENRTAIFFHSYFLPQRTNKDLRQLGYAALVRSGQLKRSEALKMLEKKVICPDGIIELLIKRLKISNKDFSRLMSKPLKQWHEFPNYKSTFETLRPLFSLLVKMGLMPKSIYVKFCIKNQASLHKVVKKIDHKYRAVLGEK